MKAKEILNHCKHRPFDYPSRAWKFYQEWNDAIFLHWEIDCNLIRPLLPNGLELDVLNGKTWVSLVAFNMNNIGIRSLPKLPHISDFQEINIRVYVICNNKPSVYFLSMEGSKRSSCKVLKSISKFPYYPSKMKRTSYSFASSNKKENNWFFTEYRLENNPVIKDETDNWLTERYATFQDYKGQFLEYDVHHVAWPMQAIEIKKLEIHYPKLNHILNNYPSKIHYSKGVQVLTWDKKKLAL
ncbi:YqjF family protein [Lacinutrix cladophorae]